MEPAPENGANGEKPGIVAIIDGISIPSRSTRRVLPAPRKFAGQPYTVPQFRSEPDCDIASGEPGCVSARRWRPFMQQRWYTGATRDQWLALTAALLGWAFDG